MRFWALIRKSRRKLGKSFNNKICKKYTHLSYLFNNLSSHMKKLLDNEAVLFGLECTSYVRRTAVHFICKKIRTGQSM
jgi:hypothetical protein